MRNCFFCLIYVALAFVLLVLPLFLGRIPKVYWIVHLRLLQDLDLFGQAYGSDLRLWPRVRRLIGLRALHEVARTIQLGCQLHLKSEIVAHRRCVLRLPS
jgi:hypothetical protein